MATTPTQRVAATRASAAEPWGGCVSWGPGVGGGEAYAEFNHVGADARAQGGFAGDGAAGAGLGFVIDVEGDLGRWEGGGEGEEEGGCAEGT